MSDPTVVVFNGGTRVTIAGGAAQRVVLNAATVALINENRPNDVVQRRDTPVNVTERATLVMAGGGMGVQGPQGIPGADGTGDLHFAFTQAIPSTQWVVVHNLAKHPAVAVTDSGGSRVVGDVQYDSINQCTLTFVGEFSGSAYFN